MLTNSSIDNNNNKRQNKKYTSYFGAIHDNEQKWSESIICAALLTGESTHYHLLACVHGVIQRHLLAFVQTRVQLTKPHLTFRGSICRCMLPLTPTLRHTLQMRRQCLADDNHRSTILVLLMRAKHTFIEHIFILMLLFLRQIRSFKCTTKWAWND